MQKHEERSRVWHAHVNDLHGGRVRIPGDGKDIHLRLLT